MFKKVLTKLHFNTVYRLEEEIIPLVIFDWSRTSIKNLLSEVL
jgi:hypothetical protein